ncbi:DUF3306 domain-containing protein [Litoricola sp.]|nr:DUF3306 domain-containing protein [Litorivicinus sp.]
MSEDKGFLSRWSDRKLSTDLAEIEAPISDLEKAREPTDEFDGKSDDEIMSILELPDPGTLKLGDTVERFMDGRVPERIRARALRAFWKTNPVLANIDGLDEYCEDYTDAATVIENLQTAYQVGKGYAIQALDAIESLADQDSAIEDENIDAIDQSISSDRQRLEASVNDKPQIDCDVVDADADDEQTLDEPPRAIAQSTTPKPRRMAFD